MKRIYLFFVMTFAVIGLSSCSDPYGAVVKAGANIAAGITAGDNTVLQLEQSGTITKQEAVNVLGYLEFANKADEALLTCATTAKATGSAKGSFSACTTAFANTLNNPAELALIHVSNSGAQTTVTAIVNAISAGASLLATSLGGA
jgi:hypothetical protein